MNDENLLRDKARAYIQAGTLPARRPDRMWGGAGTGAPCALCGEPIPREETGLDLEFREAGEPGAYISHQMHVRCFAAWELERDMQKSRQGDGIIRGLPMPGVPGTITLRDHENGYRQEPE